MRAAEAVRDGRASAMVSAGNTGATMASALLRMGRIRGVGRPASRHRSPCRGPPPRCFSTPGPTPSARPPGSSSSPRWARPSAGSASGSRSPGWLCSRSARNRAREPPCERDSAARSAPERPGRCSLRRKRGGPRRDVRRGRRDRHRRVYRKRGSQDPRRLDEVCLQASWQALSSTEEAEACLERPADGPVAARGRAGPRTPMGVRCCSASRGCASSATDRLPPRRSTTRYRSPTKRSPKGWSTRSGGDLVGWPLADRGQRRAPTGRPGGPSGRRPKCLAVDIKSPGCPKRRGRAR